MTDEQIIDWVSTDSVIRRIARSRLTRFRLSQLTIEDLVSEAVIFCYEKLPIIRKKHTDTFATDCEGVKKYLRKTLGFYFIQILIAEIGDASESLKYRENGELMDEGIDELYVVPSKTKEWDFIKKPSKSRVAQIRRKAFRRRHEYGKRPLTKQELNAVKLVWENSIVRRSGGVVRCPLTIQGGKESAELKSHGCRHSEQHPFVDAAPILTSPASSDRRVLQKDL